MSLPRLDPRHVGGLADPYALYEQYQRDDPVHWGLPYSSSDQGCWYLFRHADISAFLRDRRFRREWPVGKAAARRASAPVEQRPFLEVADQMLLSSDPPEHRRLRTLVTQAFSAPALADKRARVLDVTETALRGLTEGNSFDIVADYATSVSMGVICAVLGVPAADRERLGSWTEDFGGGLDLRKDPSAATRASRATTDMRAYFGDLVVLRRAKPQDDLLSALIAARDEHDRLSEDELLAMCIQLAFAGHDTTVAQISSTLHDLLTRPAERAQVRADPALIDQAVEESLRLHGAVHTTAARKPIEDMTIGGSLIHTGEPVIAFLGAANRDPEVFVDPHGYHLQRSDRERSAGRSIAFGAGIHYCLGAQLARLTTATAVVTLLDAFPGLRLDSDREPQRRTNIVLPGFERLPVRVS